MGEERAAWLLAGPLELVLYLGADEEANYGFDVEDAEMARLFFRFKAANRPIWIHLTGFTVDELDAFQNFINVACDIARPSCEVLDKEATRRYEEDADDSFARIYRTAPELFVREGKVQQHGQSIQGRFDGAIADPITRRRLSQSGDAGSGLPDPQQADLGGSDHGEEASGA